MTPTCDWLAGVAMHLLPPFPMGDRGAVTIEHRGGHHGAVVGQRVEAGVHVNNRGRSRGGQIVLSLTTMDLLKFYPPDALPRTMSGGVALPVRTTPRGSAVAWETVPIAERWDTAVMLAPLVIVGFAPGALRRGPCRQPRRQPRAHPGGGGADDSDSE